MKFKGQGAEEVFNRQFIEIQLRTKLQHAWATAVEAVGLVRRENLKAGEGDPLWLRFFALMACEMASEERQPLVPGVPDSERERRQELLHLDRELSAVNNLESYNDAINFAEQHITKHASYYVVRFRPNTNEVRVTPFGELGAGSAKYGSEESKGEDVIMVEVDDVRDLREAFPNYFLDVRLFLERANAYMARTTVLGRLDLSFLKMPRWRR